MGLDSKAIETLSVNAVKNSIVMSEFLDQYITENDKEPSWDGFVYIYENRSKKKENLKGRMPVQVKGRECNDFSKSEISFPMASADLQNYLNDGGCILFLVYIGNGGIRNKIYYAELTPIKLRMLLSEAKGQGSKTVYLKEFPQDNDKKATIFLNCLQNCQKQSSFKEGKLSSLEELQELGVLEGIVIPFAGVGITDPQMAIIKNEVYLYANIKGSSIPQPLDLIPQDIRTKESREANVYIGDRQFYSSCEIIKSANEVAFCFGESFKMIFTDTGKPCKIKYKNSNSIRTLAKDLDFMLSYMDEGSFGVNDIKIPFDQNGLDNSNFNVEEEREHLKFAKKIVKVLDMLRCEADIKIDELNDEDWRNLHRLVNALIEGSPIYGLKKDLAPVMLMKIGKLKFAVYLEKCEINGNIAYKIADFFRVDCSVVFDSDDGRKLPISQFAILHSKELLAIDNMDFDILLPSFQSVQYHDQTINRANWFLLDLLSAYDAAEGKRKIRLLETALKFSEWIVKSGDHELDYSIRLLNRLQTLKRKRELSEEELGKLIELVEDADTSEECKVGAYLLLGYQSAAQAHFAKLGREEKSYFTSYPIYHFWNLNANN